MIPRHCGNPWSRAPKAVKPVLRAHPQFLLVGARCLCRCGDGLEPLPLLARSSFLPFYQPISIAIATKKMKTCWPCLLAHCDWHTTLFAECNAMHTHTSMHRTCSTNGSGGIVHVVGAGEQRLLARCVHHTLPGPLSVRRWMASQPPSATAGMAWPGMAWPLTCSRTTVATWRRCGSFAWMTACLAFGVQRRRRALDFVTEMTRGLPLVRNGVAAHG